MHTRTMLPLALSGLALSMAGLALYRSLTATTEHDCPAESTIVGWETELTALYEQVRTAVTRLRQQQQAMQGRERGGRPAAEAAAPAAGPAASQAAASDWFAGLSPEDRLAVQSFTRDGSGS